MVFDTITCRGKHEDGTQKSDKFFYVEITNAKISLGERKFIRNKIFEDRSGTVARDLGDSVLG